MISDQLVVADIFLDVYDLGHHNLDLVGLSVSILKETLEGELSHVQLVDGFLLALDGFDTSYSGCLYPILSLDSLDQSHQLQQLYLDPVSHVLKRVFHYLSLKRSSDSKNIAYALGKVLLELVPVLPIHDGLAIVHRYHGLIGCTFRQRGGLRIHLLVFSEEINEVLVVEDLLLLEGN